MTNIHPPRPRLRRRLVIAAVGAAAALSLTVGTGGAANASIAVTVINTDGQGVASRSAPSLAATNGYGAPANATVTTVCWTWGDAVGPNANRLWWLISYAGRQFYANDRYLSTPNIANQPPSGEVQCGTTPPAPAPAPAPTGNYKATTTAIGNGATINVRSAPSMSARVVRTPASGSWLTITCQTVGSPLGGTWASANNRTWDRLSDGTYVHDVVTTTPGGRRVNLTDGGYVTWTNALPQCAPASAQPPPAPAKTEGQKAADWAAQQTGNKAAAEDIDAAWAKEVGLTGESIAGEWSGDCERFVEKAWGHTATPYKKPYRSASAFLDERRGQLSNSTPAPAGAVWVWKPGGVVGDKGHVALSDGKGGIHSTQGTDGKWKNVYHGSIAGLGYGAPVGWVMP